ncbi:hypothetical protein [Lysobacter sp. H23M47]|uniref:hypothetical protein n=1 Tax=Lysobacter sp. H23M47 TaxID=2781024 RepID=UPI0018802CA9|nr:hypothetical protein [Lysobacter sp. H23M47]QOW25514.1 hypothetical protein INQ43_05730 [Lysobacter sp. H23M47]
MTTQQRLEHHSILEYLYRDAGNFKTYGALLLTGYTPDADADLRACLEWGDQFVAEQVGVPVLCAEHWESVGEGSSDLDHPFHEFVCLRPATAQELNLPHGGSLKTLVTRMQAARGRWDVTLSPNCDW